MTSAFFEESGTLSAPALVIHGGAGEFSTSAARDDLSSVEDGLLAALESSWRVLAAGGPALDAVVEAVASLEASGRFNAGRGAVVNADGAVETDAAVMDGTTGSVGAICAATWPESPIRAARAVLALKGPSEGPILLAGPGADRFCERAGLAPRDAALLPGHGVAPGQRVAPISRSGTVGAVAVDEEGHVAAATSTGGRLGKLAGRVGDSPVVGAGTWADDRNVAVSGTGEGESFLVAGFAHRVAWDFSGGAPLDQALLAALGAVRERGGRGGGIVLAPDGRFAVAFDTAAMARGWRDRAGPTVGPLRPVEEGSAGPPS